MKILIAEDDINYQRLVKKEFEDEGYDVVILSRGDKALELFDSQPPNLVILDQILPDMDGIRLLKMMKENNPKIPVILNFFSDYVDDLAVWASEAYIVKSTDLSELKNVAKKFLPISDRPAELIYRDKKEASQIAKTKSDLITVDDKLIEYFQEHPEKMYELEPRKFEELIAVLLKDMGYTIELTRNTADGGVDIFAIQKTGIGESLLIVDCKRYAPHKHVGVSIVRSLYGVAEQKTATMGLIATTSYFTKQAREFQETVRHRMTLKDFDGVVEWLKNYGLWVSSL
jgi:DNA-binding response OmpR family regulator